MSESVQALLDKYYALFARPNFIALDPVQIPARFSKKEDIEIAGFLAATIAWGQRKSIINNASRLMELMENAPFDFILNHEPSDRLRFKGFVHRTFSDIDAIYFMESLQNIYKNHGGLEAAFNRASQSVKHRLMGFHELFFSLEHLNRTRKHVSNPLNESSAKRLNMYLRWMVRHSNEGVDFGIWNSIRSCELMMPLDIHTGTVSRKIGLLKRKQDDWKAVEELTAALRSFDPEDPVKYDFALFGMGVTKTI
ncbi:MAG: TIGR02757 family protein [Flavobacteriales bacterium]